MKDRKTGKPVPVKIDTKLKGCERKVFTDGGKVTTGQCAASGGHDGKHVQIKGRR